MTPLILLLAAVQAGLLLWAAVHLSNVALRPKKIAPFFWALATMAVPLAVAKYSAESDRHRALCGAADCAILALCVAGVGWLWLEDPAAAPAWEGFADVAYANDSISVLRFGPATCA